MTTRHMHFYLSAEHPCSYLPGREARSLFPDPQAMMDTTVYGALVDHGFRRSGCMVYRPGCRDCHACVPARIRVNGFRPNRSQRRTLKMNSDLVVRSRKSDLDERHLALYRDYLASRHADGDMSAESIVEMQRFLVSDWCETMLIEGWLDERLVLVAVTDVVDNALSALYTFFDPRLPKRSLGTLAVLEQIAACRRLGFTHLYLGYWIENCRKMRYKSSFSSLETRHPDGYWQPFAQMKQQS